MVFREPSLNRGPSPASKEGKKPLVHQTEGEEPEGNKAIESAAEHKEAIEFVNRHRDLFEHYARGQVDFKPAPPGLNTFAYDLKEDTIYINSRFYQSQGLSDEKTAFATLHEIEHFQEKLDLLKEKGGDRVFDRYLTRIQKSGAYKVMDNCVADIRENKTVVAKTSSTFADVEHTLYTEDLFPQTDFTDKPKHVQLSMALLREARVPGEECTVAPEVRAAIDEIKSVRNSGGTRLTDIIAHPETPMSVRLRLQDKFIWPKVEKLLEEDMSEEQKGEGDGGGDGQSDTGQGDGHGKEGKQPTKGDEKGGKPGKRGKPTKGTGKKGDPNEKFKGVYEEADKQMPHAVPVEEQKKALKEWKDGRGNPLDRADQEYANQLGVKKEELQQYRSIAEQLNKAINPETNQSVIDELRALIERIIANRKKERPAPQYPTEEGEFLVDPAELVSQVKAGNWEPKVWETQEIRMERGKRFGEVEITLVGDRSTSMNEGQKGPEQQKAAVLLMEALKEFADRLREEATNVEKPLAVRSEVYSFQSSVEDATPIKRMSEELTERDRITVAAKLGTSSGSTTDFVPLEAIANSMSEETRRAIEGGELKKIVIVFTDGGSDDKARVSRALERLRAAGIVVVGVGITEAGSPALTTYAPGARLAETAERLPVVLGDVLKEHLADL